MEQPGVQDAAVVVRQDKAGDRYLSAYIVGDEGSQGQTLDVEAVKTGLSQVMPAYMVPASVMLLEKLPITSNGKLDRRSLPEPKFRGEQAYAAPRDEREERLAEIFAQVLGVEQMGIDDNFFELGGDSIKAIRVISRIREAGYELSVKNLMLGHTIRWIALKMEKVDGIRKYSQEEIQGEVLLTPIQHEFYRWNLAKPNHFNQTVLLKSHSIIDEESLQEALKKWVSHHDMLRAVYPDQDHQWILSTTEVKGFDFSLIQLNEEQVLDEIIQETGNQLQASINLAEGPLLKVALFRSNEGDFVLICLHHLIVDGVSWRILLEDLQTAYEQVQQGTDIILPEKTASYQEWALALREYAVSEELERELPYWMETLKLAVDTELNESEELQYGESAFCTDMMELDATLTSQLLYEANHAYHTEMRDLLLTSFVRSLAPWTGHSGVMIDLEGHGRESIHRPLDIDRTVGWFTSIYPVHLPYDADMEQHICRMKELLRKIPNNGMGYGVIRHFREDVLPEIQSKYCFNYLGQLAYDGDSKQLFEMSEMPTGDSTARENHHPHSITVNASVVSGRLVLEITYDQRRYSSEQIIEFKNRFQQISAEIAAYCTAAESGKHTASDFGDLDLEFDELDEIMKSYS
jgi:non-ribosomal peptide synthase protein (TIGR01720 family)